MVTKKKMIAILLLASFTLSGDLKGIAGRLSEDDNKDQYKRRYNPPSLYAPLYPGLYGDGNSFDRRMNPLNDDEEEDDDKYKKYPYRYAK